MSIKKLIVKESLIVDIIKVTLITAKEYIEGASMNSDELWTKPIDIIKNKLESGEVIDCNPEALSMFDELIKELNENK